MKPDHHHRRQGAVSGDVRYPREMRNDVETLKRVLIPVMSQPSQDIHPRWRL